MWCTWLHSCVCLEPSTPSRWSHMLVCACQTLHVAASWCLHCDVRSKGAIKEKLHLAGIVAAPHTRQSFTESSPPVCRMLLQLLHNVLGGVKATFESAAWPVAAMGQRRNWTTAEDSLLWLGIIRSGTCLQHMLGSQTAWAQHSWAHFYTKAPSCCASVPAAAKHVSFWLLQGGSHPTLDPHCDWGRICVDGRLVALCM